MDRIAHLYLYMESKNAPHQTIFPRGAEGRKKPPAGAEGRALHGGFR